MSRSQILSMQFTLLLSIQILPDLKERILHHVAWYGCWGDVFHAHPSLVPTPFHGDIGHPLGVVYGTGICQASITRNENSSLLDKPGIGTASVGRGRDLRAYPMHQAMEFEESAGDGDLCRRCVELTMSLHPAFTMSASPPVSALFGAAIPPRMSKADAAKRQCQLERNRAAAARYREKHRTEVLEVARIRAAQRRAVLKDDPEARARAREASTRYRSQNREALAGKQRKVRKTAYIKKHGVHAFIQRRFDAPIPTRESESPEPNDQANEEDALGEGTSAAAPALWGEMVKTVRQERTRTCTRPGPIPLACVGYCSDQERSASCASRPSAGSSASISARSHWSASTIPELQLEQHSDFLCKAFDGPSPSAFDSFSVGEAAVAGETGSVVVYHARIVVRGHVEFGQEKGEIKVGVEFPPLEVVGTGDREVARIGLGIRPGNDQGYESQRT
ncbi:hypothetical protein DFH06DRAFT_1120626 [Mycena polygramma]|nr:hypothetical protein DFH06DRAFT_1120626 [Mycena polygramma]